MAYIIRAIIALFVDDCGCGCDGANTGFGCKGPTCGNFRK